MGEGVEAEAAVLEHGVASVGLDGWAHGEGAVVDHRQHQRRIGLLLREGALLLTD